ncbi:MULTISPECIES: flavin monoamine oxidase family protein [unclassified Sphingomonas]|uniref:flavin monoamine oxidase family protein n=1 Tax=unclassified Sphingomonas TaxID=196159 RepID=UPI000836BDB2|nr:MULTISPECIES: NAD(P)/FAD-dependent oxidoreductase [unclassified Sphingomonas]
MRSGGLFWSALAAARRRNLAAAGEAAPVPAQPGTTRRALLKGFAAGGVAAAIPTAAPANTGIGRVAIIGGGIAGLTALHHLREAGVDARLYEAGGRLGGRVFTLKTATGPAFELGAQLVNSDHHDIRTLAERFGVELVDRKAAPHRSIVVAGGRTVAEAELADALAPIAAQIGRDADRIDADARALRLFDAISINAYLDRHADLIRAPWVRGLLETTGRTEYGAEPDATSALSLLFNLPTVDGERADILGGSDERYAIAGGSGTLIDALALRHAAHIETGRKLLRVERATGGVRLAFADRTIVRADTAIVAVPAAVTRRIDFAVPLPSVWRRFIGAMTLGRNEKVLAAADAPRWHDAIGPGGDVWHAGAHGSWASGWDGSVRGVNGPPVWTWYLGGDATAAPESARALAQRFAADAGVALGDLAAACGDAPVRRTAWHRDPLIGGAYGSYPPGYLTRFGSLLWREGDDGAVVQAAPALGRVIFAGEHLSDAFPGYMNGGAQTGRLAAQAILGRTIPTRTA